MKLSIKECLTYGWTVFKKRPWIFVKAAIILGLVSFAFNLLSSVIQAGVEITTQPLAVVLFAIALFIVSVLSIYVGIVLDNMGVTKFYLNAHDNVETTRLKDLWAPHPFVKYVLTILLFSVMFIVGLVLLIVPGIIVALVFGMCVYLVMDRGLGPIEALKESARITKGSRWKLFLLGLAIAGINIVGLLALVIGLLVTVPVTILAGVHAYRVLSQAPAAA